MNSHRLSQFYLNVRHNIWMNYFTIFCRIALAAGFIPSGMVKILGERFTSLSNNHPMGAYLEALFHTGYYYTFIGIAQVTAAILLLIPRTAVLGALLYFPIILNICLLSLSVRFDGSLLTSPLMVLANLYLICWNFDKLQFIFPFKLPGIPAPLPKPVTMTKRFPGKFFAAVAATFITVGLLVFLGFDMKPRNTEADCKMQCNSKNAAACAIFCECIHRRGVPLNKALDNYHQAMSNQQR